VGAQAIESLGEEGVQPGVDRIRVAWPKETGAGDGVGGGAVGDLEQGSGAFPDKGLGVVVTAVEQVLPLVVGEREGTALTHRRILHGSVAPV
jgi:hypothetical protein